MARICVFGDSIAHGAWDKEGGWVQRLNRFFVEKYLLNPNFYCSVYNLSISGNTTEDLLERFEFEIKQRLKEEENKTIVIFAIGANDSDFVHSKNDFWVQPEKTKKNIKKFIEITQKFSTEIIFVGLTPAEEEKVNPMPWDTDKYSKNKNIQRYNEIIKSVCEENKIHFIEIFDEFQKTDYKKLLEDGVHPNSEGHQKIFEIVRDFLEEKKII